MRLTRHADYALRVLIYLDLKKDGATIAEIARRYRISKNHLMKVVQRLAQAGYVEATRGRGGGLVLAKEAKHIALGAVLREMEESLDLVECFDGETNTCPIAPACRLKPVLRAALAAFFEVLDAYTLADITARGQKVGRLLGLEALPQP